MEFSLENVLEFMITVRMLRSQVKSISLSNPLAPLSMEAPALYRISPH